MKALYISYDGMTDPLGQSQVLPYLEKLSERSVEIFILSFEKPEKYAAQKEIIDKIVSRAGITWVPLRYTKTPPVLSTVLDLKKMKREAMRLHRKHHFDIVHCRSYIAALAGLEMKRRCGTKFLFDMRGFYADERVDGGLWNISNPLYRMIYNYFKKKEKDFLENADYTITLTYAAREIIQGWKNIKGQPVPAEVIPCCVDLELFDAKKVSEEMLTEIRRECGLTGREFVLSYIGSLGTWYKVKEMLQFFKRFLSVKPEAVFLFVTHDDHESVLRFAAQMDISQEKLRFKKAARNEMPGCILASNVSLFFIQPVFSKKASSPTKQGEIMAMEIPIVCNAGVGDTDFVIQKYRAGWVVNDFSEEEYDKVIREMSHPLNKQEIRAGAKEFYSLAEGVKRYSQVYSKLAGQ